MDQITNENIDQWLFNNLEGDLSAQEIEELNNYLEVNPAMSSEQEQWSEANFKAIEIEEYPGLKAIQKGRGPWWKKSRFFFTITLATGLLVLFYYSQYSNSEVNFDESQGIRTLIVNESSVPPVIESQQKQTIAKEPVVSEKSVTPSWPKKEKKNDSNMILPADPAINKKTPSASGDSDSLLTDASFEMPFKLEFNKLEVLFLPLSLDLADTLFASNYQSNPTLSKNLAKRYRKAKRKEDKKRFEQNATRGIDPKIIPIESIGF